MAMQHPIATISISDVTISTDSDGRYCLNDLHRAAGGEAKHKPANFLRLDSTQALITEIDQFSEVRSAKTINGGISPGTYVVRELVYAYAMWISPKFHLTVIRAFDGLVQNQDSPQFTTSLKNNPDLDSLRFLPIAAKAARAIGLKGNMAAISADQAVRAITGSSALRLLGQSALKAEEQEPLLTVTEIAQKLGFPVKTVNPLLVQIGFQTKDRNTKGELTYELTEAGKKYGVYLDTSKRHGDGTPVRQIKWLSSVVSYINQLSLKSEAA